MRDDRPSDYKTQGFNSAEDVSRSNESDPWKCTQQLTRKPTIRRPRTTLRPKTERLASRRGEIALSVCTRS